MDISELIIEEDFSLKTDVNDVYVAPDIPKKSLIFAAKVIVSDRSPEDIIAMVDTSHSKLGIEGIVFTRDALCIK